MVSNYKRKTKRAAYSKENLKAAVELVRNGFLSGYKAAKKYGIPRMTIMDHVLNRRTKSNTLGRSTILSEEVENKLAISLHFMEKHGFGLTKAEVLDTVAEYVNKNKILTPFKNGKPGSSWFTGFKKRHHLSVKKPQAVEYSRKKAINPFIVFPYFKLVEETLKKLKLLEKPSAIWNMDETSFSRDPAKTRIVGVKGHAAIRVISSPGKDNTTVLLGANAQGDKLPPLIIYKGKHMWDTWVSPDAYPGTTYAATKNGWMESDVFETYFKNSFLPAIGEERPVLLIYDGHATHVGLNIIEEARKANVTILKLPAHTSHVLQPLDLAVMKPFKDRWDQLLVQWQRLNIGATLSKREFSRLIGLIWTQIDKQVVINGFRKAGIFPLNPEVVEEKLYDSLQLKQWKDLQSEYQNNIDETTLEEHPIHEDERCTPRTLLSLALDCVARECRKATHEGYDDQQYFYICDESLRKPDELKTDIRLHSHKPSSYNLPESIKECVSNDTKKIQILEDRIVSFEELLLMKIKTGNNAKLKRRKLGPGAEIITHDEVVKRKTAEEKIKNVKKEPKTIKIKKEKSTNSLEPIPGPSGITKKYSNKKPLQTKSISKKGKGIGKKSHIKKEERNTTARTRNKKRVAVASEDSTSVSDCISIYSDSDICNSEESLNLTPDEMAIPKNYSEERQKEGIKVDCEIEKTNFENKEKDETIFDTEIGYAMNDKVLVRYYSRKKWTYYVGFIEGFKPGHDDDGVYYTIRFFKTVKKPLKFILTKKIDRDDVPSIHILKKIMLSADPGNPKYLVLCNNEDMIYFS